MKINVKQVTFKSLEEVAYGHGIFSLREVPKKKVTVEFSVRDNKLSLTGFIELTEDEYFENVKELESFIKAQLKED